MSLMPLQRRPAKAKEAARGADTRSSKALARAGVPRVMPPDSAAERTAERVSKDPTGSTGDLIAAHGAAHGAGVPLPSELSDQLDAATSHAPTLLGGNKYGLPISELKVHADSSSTAIARKLCSRAFTFRDEVYFDRDYFSPDSSYGRRLLGHEAAHILAQRRAYGDAAMQPHIHRSMIISRGAGSVQYKVHDHDTKGRMKQTRSDKLFTEWTEGLETFLGLRAKYAVTKDGWSITKVEKLDEGKDDKRKDILAKLDRDRVRDVVFNKINGTDTDVYLGEGIKSPAAEFKGDIWIDKKIWESMVIAKDSAWSGFWILLHELLHATDEKYKDARVKGKDGEEIKSGYGYLDYQTEERDFNWRGGTRGRHNLTVVGTADQAINTVRTIHGLPTRETYADMTEWPDTYNSPGAVFRQTRPDGTTEDFYGFVIPAQGNTPESEWDSQNQLLDYVPVRENKFKAKREAEETAQQDKLHDFSREWAPLLARTREAVVAPQRFTLSLWSHDGTIFGFYQGGGEAGRVSGTVTPKLVKGLPDGLKLKLELAPRGGQGNGGSRAWVFDLSWGEATQLRNQPMIIRSAAGEPLMDLHFPAVSRQETQRRRRQRG